MGRNACTHRLNLAACFILSSEQGLGPRGGGITIPHVGWSCWLCNSCWACLPSHWQARSEMLTARKQSWNHANLGSACTMTQNGQSRGQQNCTWGTPSLSFKSGNRIMKVTAIQFFFLIVNLQCNGNQLDKDRRDRLGSIPVDDCCQCIPGRRLKKVSKNTHDPEVQMYPWQKIKES